MPSFGDEIEKGESMRFRWTIVALLIPLEILALIRAINVHDSFCGHPGIDRQGQPLLLVVSCKVLWTFTLGADATR